MRNAADEGELDEAELEEACQRRMWEDENRCQGEQDDIFEQWGDIDQEAWGAWEQG